VTDGPARRLAEAFGRRGLAAPARLLADAHRPLEPLLSDLGAAIGPLLDRIGGRQSADLHDLVDRPGGLDRLIEALDRRAAGGSRADSR
jgi:hypothetical protein